MTTHGEQPAVGWYQLHILSEIEESFALVNLISKPYLLKQGPDFNVNESCLM